MKNEYKNTLELKIRRHSANVKYTNFAHNVHHKAYHDVVVKQFGNWDEERQDRYFSSDWKDGNGFEIIFYDGEPCGYCRFDYLPEYIIAHELVISPDFQGNGIGTKILKEVIEYANVKNLPIKIGVLKENKALNLYRKLGFKDVDESETHKGLKYLPNSGI